MILRRLYAAMVIAASLAASGCSTIAYYSQAINGQYQLLERQRPISALVKDPATSAQLKARLEETMRIRDFAVHELDLPDNGSYLDYVDLKRPYVVWNVYAAPQLSLRPHKWCFPIAGCVAYRGYFALSAAQNYARHLRRRGYDVYVAGVTAYSTLGWFRDPVLSTILRHPETDIAELMFHELAHQKLYIPGDTAFDESFAVAVSRAGMRRWLLANGSGGQLHRYLELRHRRAQVSALLLHYRARLEALYSSAEPRSRKLQDKRRILSGLRAAYVGLEEKWGEKSGNGLRYFRNINNAYFVPIGLYDCYVGAFNALLASVGGKLPAFYAKARQIGRLPARERRLALEALTPNDRPHCTGNPD